MMRKGFTLMEVTLAMSIMAVGVMGLISLYSLGYRENRQSLEDIEAAVLAERNINALVTMLSSTNMTWSQWKQIGLLPDGGENNSGWSKYFDHENIDERGGRGRTGSTNGDAAAVFEAIRGACSGCEGADAAFDPGHLECGLVVCQTGPICAISFRAGRRAGTLMQQPLYYTEVCFQGMDTSSGGESR